MKKIMVIVVLFLLAFSLFAHAEDESDDCNFFCKVGRFLWGNAEKRLLIGGEK